MDRAQKLLGGGLFYLSVAPTFTKWLQLNNVGYVIQLNRGRFPNFSDKVLKYYLDSSTSTDDMHLNIKNSFLTLYIVN